MFGAPSLSTIHACTPLLNLNQTQISSRSVALNPSSSRFSHRCQASFRSTFEERTPLVHTARKASTLYDVLHVNKNASPVEIKSAYRSLAKMYHPDANSNAHVHDRSNESDAIDFIEIHNAYATLSDPSARIIYDLSLSLQPHMTAVGESLTKNSISGFYPTRKWETDQCW